MINTSSVYKDNEYSLQKHRHDNFSFGVDYKYAFNFNNFFIAPGVFFDNNSHKNYSTSSSGEYSAAVKYSYGVKVNLGYDVTEKFSPFVTLGHSESRMSEGNYYGSLEMTKENSTEEGLIYGLGFRYNLTDAVSVNAAYEITQLGGTKNFDDLVVGNDKLNSSYRVAKLGVAYNF